MTRMVELARAVRSLASLVKELGLWVPVGLIPILNGALRMSLYARWLGEPWASRLSSALDVLLLGTYACFAQRRWPVVTRGGAVSRGLLWISMTTSNHFILGAFVFGIPWPALVDKYDLLDGELWPLVSLAILAAPVLGRWKVAPRAPLNPPPASRTGAARAPSPPAA
jgi:hypothetical protein